MKEIGGYIELDSFHNEMLHENAIKLNCAKNCLAYLFLKKPIKRVHIPYFLCDSIFDTCTEYGVEMVKYHVNERLMPILEEEILDSDWLYLVNYYGQLTTEVIEGYRDKYKRVILDNVQDYYRMPVVGVDTFYSCRKFFGVADGAILYSDIELDADIPIDESYSRMEFLLGRYEKDANTFYQDYVNNNKLIRNAPIRRMSRLTTNLLHAVDYERVCETRTRNYGYLRAGLEKSNSLTTRHADAPFAYPFYHKNGSEIRKALISRKIYVPILWPNVGRLPFDCLERELAENILPLPCDQRYSEEDMEYIVQNIAGGI